MMVVKLIDQSWHQVMTELMGNGNNYSRLLSSKMESHRVSL